MVMQRQEFADVLDYLPEVKRIWEEIQTSLGLNTEEKWRKANLEERVIKLQSLFANLSSFERLVMGRALEYINPYCLGLVDFEQYKPIVTEIIKGQASIIGVISKGLSEAFALYSRVLFETYDMKSFLEKKK